MHHIIRSLCFKAVVSFDNHSQNRQRWARCAFVRALAPSIFRLVFCSIGVTFSVLHFCFKMEYLLIAVSFSLSNIQPIILIRSFPCSFHPSILLCILSLIVESSLNMCPIQFHCLHGIILVRQLLSSAILRTSSADFVQSKYCTFLHTSFQQFLMFSTCFLAVNILLLISAWHLTS